MHHTDRTNNRQDNRGRYFHVQGLGSVGLSDWILTINLLDGSRTTPLHRRSCRVVFCVWGNYELVGLRERRTSKRLAWSRTNSDFLLISCRVHKLDPKFIDSLASRYQSKRYGGDTPKGSSFSKLQSHGQTRRRWRRRRRLAKRRRMTDSGIFSDEGITLGVEPLLWGNGCPNVWLI